LLFAFLLRCAPASALGWRCLTRAERSIAALARETLAQIGQTAPDLNDRDLVAWFAAAAPLLLPHTPLPRRSAPRARMRPRHA
jgi:hypothetical protein